MTGIPVTSVGVIKAHFRTEIMIAFKQLLQTKHLYQSLRIKPFSLPISPDLTSDASGPSLVIEITEEIAKEANEEYSKIRWDLHQIRSIGTPAARSGIVNNRDSIIDLDIPLPDIKIYCQACRNVEAHNLIKEEELLTAKFHNGDDWSNQIFVLYYECQACKEKPTVFIIQRQGLKIRLAGRVPMEKVLVPTFLPEGQKDYFSDSLIAYNSGQFLPGVFMLRIFIEQYLRSRSATPNIDKMDVLFAEYGEKLPPDFKNRFPSLKDVYDNLSVVIHMGDRSEKADVVFQKALKDIEDHFDAKRVFHIGN